MHGAGLAHLVWLPPQGAVVEILPKGLSYVLYRNLATLSGKVYFSVHAETPPAPGVS